MSIGIAGAQLRVRLLPRFLALLELIALSLCSVLRSTVAFHMMKSSCHGSRVPNGSGGVLFFVEKMYGPFEVARSDRRLEPREPIVDRLRYAGSAIRCCQYSYAFVAASVKIIASSRPRSLFTSHA